VNTVVFWDVASCCLQILTDGSEKLIAPIIRVMMMSSSETSVNIYQITRCYIPKDSHIHARRRENLKSHKMETCFNELHILLCLLENGETQNIS
jgi:hypothetical protein